MVTFLTFSGLLAGAALFGAWRERCRSEDRCVNHRPMATRLIDGERFHVCEYVETMCVTCRKPPPTLTPGPGVSCPR